MKWTLNDENSFMDLAEALRATAKQQPLTTFERVLGRVSHTNDTEALWQQAVAEIIVS